MYLPIHESLLLGINDYLRIYVSRKSYCLWIEFFNTAKKLVGMTLTDVASRVNDFNDGK